MLEFGMEHSGSYMKSKLEGLVDQAKHYPSSNFNDELSWGAIWLYFATGVSHAMTRMSSYWKGLISSKAYRRLRKPECTRPSTSQAPPEIMSSPGAQPGSTLPPW